ncbi:ubiquinol-cytochrome c reductase complex assembly factor 4-like [Glandiceps talaboti]
MASSMRNLRALMLYTTFYKLGAVSRYNRVIGLSRSHAIVPTCTNLLVRLKSNNVTRNTTIEDNEDEEDNTPIKYTTSAASKWTVDESFGSRKTAPIWMKILISGTVCGILLWAVFREETETDRILESGLLGLELNQEDEQTDPQENIEAVQRQ